MPLDWPVVGSARHVENLPRGSGYLDEIFAAIRAFSREIGCSRDWLTRAERTESRAWRLSFLAEARAAWERAPAHLDAAGERLAALGPAESLPPPLDRVHSNLAVMRADLEKQGEQIGEAEAELADGAVGRA